MHPVYENHQFADIFPPMAESELAELTADIKAKGLQLPIVLCDEKILDGRNRYLACEKAGVTPKFVQYEGNDPLQYCLSLNLKRRHLTTSQRAAIAFKLCNLPQGARTDLASNEARIGQSQAGEMMTVSRSSVQRVAAISAADPELV